MVDKLGILLASKLGFDDGCVDVIGVLLGSELGSNDGSFDGSRLGVLLGSELGSIDGYVDVLGVLLGSELGSDDGIVDDDGEAVKQPSVGTQVAPLVQKSVSELTSLLLYHSQRS